MSPEVLRLIPPEQLSNVASFIQQLAENGNQAEIPVLAIALGIIALLGSGAYYLGGKLNNFTEKYPEDKLDEGIGRQIPDPKELKK